MTDTTGPVSLPTKTFARIGSTARETVGARDRTQLAVLAHETGLVHPGWIT